MLGFHLVTWRGHYNYNASLFLFDSQCGCCEIGVFFFFFFFFELSNFIIPFDLYLCIDMVYNL